MIPEGWNKSNLGKLFEFKNGLNGEKSRYGSGVSFANVMDIFRGPRLHHSDIVGLVQVSEKQLSDYGLRVGDVLFNRTSETKYEIAMASVYVDEQPSVFGGFVIRARPKTDRLDANFNVYSFQSEQVRREMIRLGQGSIRVNIGQGDLATVPKLLPPLAEQRRIAEILGAWDEAIAAVEALIANTQAQKKALMQTLLTAQKRLPGFSGEWTETSLNEVFDFKRGKGLSKGVVSKNGANKCILYGELYTRYTEVINKVIGRTDSGDGLPSKAYDVLIPASTTTTGIDLANATAVMEGGILLSGDINVLRPKSPNISAPFFAYLLTHIMKYKIASRAQGVTIIHLYGSDLKPLTANIPEYKEQHAIAAVIMDTDKKILELQSQLNALRHEKAGLMQQLLTGKRRVKGNEREEV